MPEDAIRAAFDLDVGTGSLTRRPNAARSAWWNARYSGASACVDAADGYLRVKLNGRYLTAHRVVWVLADRGPLPSQIDHINGVRTDNRPENLRAATPQQNQQNARRHVDGGSGFKGVHWHRVDRKWQARITVAGRRRHLGYFDKPIEAHAAYVAAAQKAFGEYANAGHR
jgi:hypothetical protein